MDVRKRLGRSLSIGVVAAALILGVVVLYLTTRYPRTDDAEILANFIGIAPQVEGPIVRLNVRDNQFVTKGTLLFEIDDRPYRYALAQALSEQAALEGQIADERRRIAALVSAVSVSAANVEGSHADLGHWAAAVEQARAEVVSAEEGVQRARAEWNYASNNLRRLEPLLSRQFVTVDQVDRARTSEVTQAQALKQAESQLAQAQAGLASMQAQYTRAQAALGQSRAAHQQAQHAVTTLEPLINQRGARQSAVDTARYNLDNSPRLCAVRRARHQSHDFRRRLRPRRAADVHPHRRAHLVGRGELPRGPAQAHRAWDARRRLCHVEARRALYGDRGKHRLRRDAGPGSHRHTAARSSGCAAHAELGAPGHEVSRSRPRAQSVLPICSGSASRPSSRLADGDVTLRGLAAEVPAGGARPVCREGRAGRTHGDRRRRS